MLDKDFLKVIKEIESVQKTFATQGATKEYEKYWPIGKIIEFPSVSRKTAEVLYKLVEKNRPKTILELGTCIGYSTLWLAKASESYKGFVYTIDLSKKEHEIANTFFKKAKLANIQTITSYIDDALKNWNKKVDFLFIDADKHNYLIYLKKLEKFLNKNAIVVADNILSHKELLKDYVDYVKNNPNYSTTLLKIDKGLLVSRKK
ncbi:MAG: class I SAM-dependent methyltransferase [Candidatus Pacearchaeota archaeon]|jgi:predicted O-methyltransferase YrrM